MGLEFQVKDDKVCLSSYLYPYMTYKRNQRNLNEQMKQKKLLMILKSY